MTGNEKLYWAMNDARDLLTKGWCKGAESMRIDGTRCEPDSRDAAQFCIMGSINRTSKSSNERESMIASLLPFVPSNCSDPKTLGTRISRFNDNEKTTIEDVLTVFDDAMDSLKQETFAETTDQKEYLQ